MESQKNNRAIVVGIASSYKKRWDVKDNLTELTALMKTLGYVVLEKLVQYRPHPDPAYFIGKGKVNFIKDVCAEMGISTIAFDTYLTGIQLRNLRKSLKITVLDKELVILKIFELHAKTTQAKSQVELAQLKYRLSHLVGYGKEMSRLGGGIGTRGPGEQKLELNRRKINEAIYKIQHKLKTIEKQSKEKSRQRKRLFNIALAGYTNAGKSSLLNVLTNKNVYTSNYLFSTLDTLSRKLEIKQGIPIIINDTVGFIKDLPDSLIKAFETTLSVIKEANLILHIVDVSDKLFIERYKKVKKYIEKLGAKNVQNIVVFNKIDKHFYPYMLSRIKSLTDTYVLVSAKTGAGINKLLDLIWESMQSYLMKKKLTISYSNPLLYKLTKRFYTEYLEKKDETVTLLITGYPFELAPLTKAFS